MGSLGHTQYRWTGLIQISDLTGAYGVSFLVMFAAACIARMAPPEAEGGQPRGRAALWPVVPLALALGGALGYGATRAARDVPEPLARIALVQESIDTELKFDPTMRDRVHDRYLKLSHEAVREHGKVDLIVWPETMFREALIYFDPDARPPVGWSHSEPEFRLALAEEASQRRNSMGAIARELDTAMLLGVDAVHYSARGPQFLNSAAFVSPSGEVLGRYDKMHLVLFGEYVPLADRWPWLQRFTPLSVSCTPGRGPAAFDAGGLRVAPNICYESVMPHVLRGQVAGLARGGREPDVLVNLTNDGWFWGSSELDMHLACGVFRAVECRKPFLIAANTGFSAWIDGDGRILARGPRRDVGTVLASVGPDGRSSWYLRHGDWFAGACLAACAGLAMVGLRARAVGRRKS
jgi:apolipoprotein N-acyltransferase